MWEGGSNLPTVSDFVVKQKKKKNFCFKKKKLPLRRLLQCSETFCIDFDADPVHSTIAMW